MDMTQSNIPRTRKRKGPGNNVITGGSGKVLYEDKDEGNSRSSVITSADG
jgi:hypothetical protein